MAKGDLIPIDYEDDVQEIGSPEDIAMEIEFLEEGADPFGDVEVDQGEAPYDHLENLAETIAIAPEGEDDLKDLASELIEQVDQDIESRSDWDTIQESAIDLLGFKIESPDRPFPGACGASHPVLSQAVVKFQAKAFKELYPSQGPARTKVIGEVTPEKEQQALRVREFLNYQTTKVMTEYGPQLDKLLFHAALYGSAFKKTYWDPALNRPASRLVKASDFIIDYYADDLETAERYTHRVTFSTNEITRYEIAGMYRKLDLGSPPDPESDPSDDLIDEYQGRTRPSNVNNMHTLYEIHANLDLAGFEDPSGLMLPYVITIDKDTEQILAIRRNWKEGDTTFKKNVWFTHYSFVPGLGFYSYGYLHLIGGLAKTATSSLRQLTDAGTMSNLPAGFKAHGLRMLSPDEPIMPGEWREANAPAGDLSKSLMPLPYKEPSATLFQLMQFMVETAKEFADQTDAVIAESSNYGPVGTTLALLEASGKLFSAIHQRMHAAQAHDLALLAQLNFENLPEDYPYQVSGGNQKLVKQDFDPAVIDVLPVSDPNMPTEAHRVAKLNAILSIAAQDPQAHNMDAIRLDIYRAMGVDQPEKYLAQSQQPFGGDPVTENSMAMMGKPITVPPTQEDDAHILVHSMVLNNPAYKENVQMRQIMMAHINEHMAMKFRKEMVQVIGQTDPQMAQMMMQQQQQQGQMPPEMEQAISIAAANASDAVLKLDEVKAKAIEGKLVDPAQELQEADQAIRKAKNTADVKLDAARLLLDRDQMKIDDENEDADRAMKLVIEQMKLKEKKKLNATSTTSSK